MQHIMIDLETMDDTPTAAIVAIGAVAFDLNSGEIGEQFYLSVDLDSSYKHGGTIGPGAVKWWLRQPREAQCEIVTDNAATINYALRELECFIIRSSPSTDTILWSQGADFDFPIITSAMARIGMRRCWKYWNVRDVRTIVHAAEEAGFNPSAAVDFVGQKHHALHDAIHQTRILLRAWQNLVKPHRNEPQL
ncbi:TPA: 3'-5' exoribonuclease [Enterobacter ludwigii]|nr:3'-5' exoribonuclease [Enterobacter ludwigii]HDR2591119.1 3'-5' exoribonuclease [Enterobacter ludwigii]HDR2598686.1 3'-5' exoribonuclease [Enterobacter ludwigii]